ncbi:MAG: anthranilate phosphoribosyltransferase [Armatimonadetes bacterium]|nr:anthranilate phosphoribosyltransferase [Armatimonadota bacterium]
MTVEQALRKVLDGGDLTKEEANQALSHLMIGETHHGLIGGFLVAMASKGVTGQELAGFADCMRRHAVSYDFGVDGLVDTCGTGGGRESFNMSSAAAILAAACGAKVAKHGNRAVTSHCGSADVLEALGIPLELSFEEQKRRLNEFGLAFLFAPHHHPAVRHVAPVRKALGVRTFFNLLGPLANPAGAKRMMIGVFDVAAMRPMAEALAELGAEHAFVVHGTDGMDEISPCVDTLYIEVKDGQLSEGGWKPSDFGLSDVDYSALESGSTVQENAEILKESVSNASSRRLDAIIPNVAVTLMLAGLVDSPLVGAEMARQAVQDGKGAALISALAGE